jgi:hypothetical protein
LGKLDRREETVSNAERWQGDEPQADAEEELDEGVWELDPNDPSHPDYDLSVSAGYSDWDPAPKPLLLRRGVMLLLTVLVIVGLMLPILIRLT